jgi:hypothetical protein
MFQFTQVAIPDEIASIARGAVALLFLFAASAKLARPSSTSAALGVLRVPEKYRTGVTRLLAVAEVVIAAALLTIDDRSALLAPAVMLLAFTLFLGYLAYRRSPVACGCLGDLGSQSHRLGLSRNLCLLGLLALAASGDPGGTTLWSVLGGTQVAVLLVLLTEGIYTVHGLRVVLEAKS